MHLTALRCFHLLSTSMLASASQQPRPTQGAGLGSSWTSTAQLLNSKLSLNSSGNTTSDPFNKSCHYNVIRYQYCAAALHPRAVHQSPRVSHAGYLCRAALGFASLGAIRICRSLQDDAGKFSHYLQSCLQFAIHLSPRF